MDIDTYLETARKNAGVPSYSKLAMCLGISKAAVSAIATGKTLPADDTIIKIANCANIPAETALVDLAIWRNKNNAAAVKAWQNVRAKIAL